MSDRVTIIVQQIQDVIFQVNNRHELIPRGANTSNHPQTMLYLYTMTWTPFAIIKKTTCLCSCTHLNLVNQMLNQPQIVVYKKAGLWLEVSGYSF